MPTTGGGAVTLAGLYFTDAPSVYLDGVQVSATQRYSPPSTKLISPSTEHVDSSFFLFFLFFLFFFSFPISHALADFDYNVGGYFSYVPANSRQRPEFFFFTQSVDKLVHFTTSPTTPYPTTTSLITPCKSSNLWTSPWWET